jgi:hypothetical protein
MVPQSLRLSFDFNIAMLAVCAERRAMNEQLSEQKGPINSREQARAAIAIAKADLQDWDSNV